MTSIYLFIAVFLATFALDFIWTKYIAEVGNKRAHRAAMWSSFMIPLAAITARAYTSDHLWLIVPAMLGAYSSTWLAVRREVVREASAQLRAAMATDTRFTPGLDVPPVTSKLPDALPSTQAASLVPS